MNFESGLLNTVIIKNQIMYTHTHTHQKITNVSEDVEKLEHLSTASGDENGATALENSMAVTKNIKYKIII